MSSTWTAPGLKEPPAIRRGSCLIGTVPTQSGLIGTGCRRSNSPSTIVRAAPSGGAAVFVFFQELMPGEGFEPPTFGLQIRNDRLIAEYGRIRKDNSIAA